MGIYLNPGNSGFEEIRNSLYGAHDKKMLDICAF